MEEYTTDYLLDQKVKIFQGIHSYRTSSDAVLLSAMIKDLKESQKILDVGSGAGGISLCLAHRFLQNEIDGLEIQPDLVKLSNMSADANGFQNLKYFKCDISTNNIPFNNMSFDFVVTNPPYEKNGMISPNESKALAHHEQNIGLNFWLQFCLKMLKPYGTLCMIHRADVLDEILSILYQKTGKICVLPVYSKKGQKAKRVIIRAQKDSKAPLEILPPLVIHNQDNSYTPLAQSILREGKAF